MRILLLLLVIVLAACGSSPEPTTEPAAAPTAEPAAAAGRAGEIRLSSYEWDWAPWLKDFTHRLHEHWEAPYAYRLGVVSGGTTLKFTVEKDGTFHDIEILEKTGHKTLHEASVEVIEELSGMASLPADYPLENLTIELSLHYPPWRIPTPE